MTSVKLTQAQKRFIELFDLYTMQGLNPLDYRLVQKKIKIQFRTINQCRRLGLIKKANKDSEKFIVNPKWKEKLGLSAKITIQTKKIQPRKRIVKNDLIKA